MLAVPHRLSRRAAAALIGFMLLTCLSTLTTRLSADEPAVPISLEVELLLKVAAYDKNLPSRAGDRVRLVVLVRNKDADSGRAAAQAMKALSSQESVAGLPLESASVTFTDAPSLAKQVSEKRISIIFVMPGFSERELGALGKSLDGVSVLSAGAMPKHASQGTVLAFDLVGGKPKILVHLGQAKKQKVQLSSSVLKLMKVVE